MPQDQRSTPTWSQDMHHDTLVSAVEDDDFAKFLDLGGGFEQFQQLNEDDGQTTTLETPMGRLAFGQNMMQGMDLVGNSPVDHRMLTAYEMRGSGHQQGQQQYNPYHMYQQMDQTRHHFHIPPTPVSAEMHAAKYGGQLDNAGQLIFDRNQASFTPLVSPAQTPLDGAFNMPDYVVADDFFSPLTSPAIEAQPQFASTNATTSPIDLNSESISASSAPHSTAKKPRRKANMQGPRSNARSVKQSPAMKPQPKRRQFSIGSIPLDQMEGMLEASRGKQRLQPTSTHATTVPSSEDSASPEALNELLMRPPPVPGSTSRSPTSVTEFQKSESNMPATPAMLMRMPGKQPVSKDQQDSFAVTGELMEDINLPDAAADLPARIIPDVNTNAVISDDQSTPTLSAKTPKLSADSTPRSCTTKTQNNSNDSLEQLKRSETKSGGRLGKKRQSVSSAAISPALRPKISPSISPLVPSSGTGVPRFSAENSALYLASKSNYQNILDGTHLPGVSYPDTLAENLSSKRTSHKLAEQGRRNRINVALKEIESLLPPAIISASKKDKATSSKENDEESTEKGSSAAQGASKASTVEMAITYIKALQAELDITKEKLQAAEKTIAEGQGKGS